MSRDSDRGESISTGVISREGVGDGNRPGSMFVTIRSKVLGTDMRELTSGRREVMKILYRNVARMFGILHSCRLLSECR